MRNARSASATARRCVERHLHELRLRARPVTPITVSRAHTQHTRVPNLPPHLPSTLHPPSRSRVPRAEPSSRVRAPPPSRVHRALPLPSHHAYLEMRLPRSPELVRERPRPVRRHVRHHPSPLHDGRAHASKDVRTAVRGAPLTSIIASYNTISRSTSRLPSVSTSRRARVERSPSVRPSHRRVNDPCLNPTSQPYLSTLIDYRWDTRRTRAGRPR